jgi:transposase
MRRYALRDDQWDRIKDILPGREGHVGVTAKDNRLFVEAVFYRYRAGIPWRDLPERFGDPIKIHTRFSRWAKSGAWKKIFEMLAADADNEYSPTPDVVMIMFVGTRAITFGIGATLTGVSNHVD